MEDVCALLADPALSNAPLIVDATGVGRGVTDLFRDAHRDGHMSRYPIPVTITAGEQANGLHVPKQDLVSRIQALLQSGRLLVAAGLPLRDKLERELLGITRGPVPYFASLADGSIDLSQVPDFIPAVDGDRNVWWIWSADVLPPPGEDRVEIVTVYADDLTAVIGRMFPDAGFVAPRLRRRDARQPASES